MSIKTVFSFLSVVALTGCSHYPIPDDISPLSTEKIVRFGRCEMRSAIMEHMVRRNIIGDISNSGEIKARIATLTKKQKDRLPLDIYEQKLARITKVAVVYSFEFDIIETNRAGAGAAFKLPLVSRLFDVGGEAEISLVRHGSRVFGAEDSWYDLITDTALCKDTTQQSGNIVYPLTGSIGVGRVVETFIDIDEQGGAKDNFVDTLTFTTSIGGSANASIKLDPVPKQFRPVSAAASYSASRVDIHKLTISLAFPQPDRPQPITGVTRVDGDLNAPFTRPADWRARYNLCVADARVRESSFKTLRLEAPEVYCIRYADAFAPQSGFKAERSTSARASRSSPPVRTLAPGTAAPSPSVPSPQPQPRLLQQIRPNAPL